MSLVRSISFRNVSIHAPVWGATCMRVPLTRTFEFQSTRPYGARRSGMKRIFSVAGFNPRARMGRDKYCLAISRRQWVSIHAPVWGATRVGQC